ncbi:hypothetical protein J6590_090437 [Homalodisca vitripennis]|nr:hypothetical protein J6590_090437 [Homalodisca vitripennis]
MSRHHVSVTTLSPPPTIILLPTSYFVNNSKIESKVTFIKSRQSTQSLQIDVLRGPAGARGGAMVLMHCQENNSLLCSNHVKSKADNRKSITVVPQLMSARGAQAMCVIDYCAHTVDLPCVFAVSSEVLINVPLVT